MVQLTISCRFLCLMMTSVVQATELARQESTGSTGEDVVVVVEDVVGDVVGRTRHSRSV